MNYNYNPYNYMQPQQPQFTFVSGLEGAKAFIVAPNQTVYLKDNDNNILYEKKVDASGHYTLNAYELKPIEQSQSPTYVTTNDLNALKSFFMEQMNILSSEIKKLNITQNTGE